MLKSHFSLPNASPGAMLREEKLAGSTEGLEADRLTSTGRLVPDRMINAVVAAWLERQPGDGFVFDGYPRTLGQAEALDGMLASRGTPLEVAVLLDADLSTLRARVKKRLTCGVCGNIASTDLIALPGGRCPRCGGAFFRRKDDNAETFVVRFQEYLEKTSQVATYYEKRHLLSRAEAAGSRDQVFTEVCRILNA